MGVSVRSYMHLDKNNIYPYTYCIAKIIFF